MLIVPRETIEKLCAGSLRKRTIKIVLTALLLADPQAQNIISPELLKNHTNMRLTDGEWRDIMKQSAHLLPPNIKWGDK